MTRVYAYMNNNNNNRINKHKKIKNTDWGTRYRIRISMSTTLFGEKPFFPCTLDVRKLPEGYFIIMVCETYL